MELLHYSFDALRLGGLAVRATDEGGSFDVVITAGELAHVDFAAAVDHHGVTRARLAAIETLADVLNAAFATLKTGTGDWLVEYNPPPHGAGRHYYSVGYDNHPAFALDFRAASVGARGPTLAAAMGFTSAAAIVSSGSELTSSVRPRYVLVPAAGARTKVSPDRYDAAAATDARTDGGLYGQTAVAKPAVTKEWTQAGEDDGSIASVAYHAPGTPVHAYRATAAIPWSYQHAWDHALSYKCAIRVDDDHPGSPPEVVEMRADGLSFSPLYTGADDYPMYSLEYRTRLLGRILA